MTRPLKRWMTAALCLAAIMTAFPRNAAALDEGLYFGASLLYSDGLSKYHEKMEDSGGGLGVGFDLGFTKALDYGMGISGGLATMLYPAILAPKDNGGFILDAVFLPEIVWRYTPSESFPLTIGLSVNYGFPVSMNARGSELKSGSVGFGLQLDYSLGRKGPALAYRHVPVKLKDVPGMSKANAGGFALSYYAVEGPVKARTYVSPDSGITSATEIPKADLGGKSTPGGGVYGVEPDLDFNVLDGVAVDASSRRLIIYGHRDDRYGGPPIPYLQHLSVLLKNPRPEFSLNWTPKSSRAVDAFIARTESPEDVKRVTDQWGHILEPGGGLTPAGRLLLPAWGAAPTLNGEAPGTLGIGVADGDLGQIWITSVAPGGPAARAGLLPGDLIVQINGDQCLPTEEFLDAVRFAGAGAKVHLIAYRGGDYLPKDIVLDAEPGDPWRGTTSNDAAGALFGAAGMKTAQAIIHFHPIYERLDNHPSGKIAFAHFIGILGLRDMWNEYDRKIANGEIGKPEAILLVCRAIFRNIDRAFELTGNPTLAAFNRSYEQSGDPVVAFGQGLLEINRWLRGSLSAALDKLWQRPEGVQIPAELIEASYGIHPVVEPEYIGVDGASQLARVMYESDYLGKRLVNAPAMARRIPGYQTHFGYKQTHPGSQREGTFHMWISVASLDLARSADGAVLETRKASMRFNVRSETGRDLPREADSYEDLLTSLYDDLARLYPVLHELRECAKLAGAAEWLRARHPEVSLPSAGLGSWKGPSSVPGMVFFYLHPDPYGRPYDTTVMAAGGVSLEPFPPGAPKLPINEDSSVVDLRDKTFLVPVIPDVTAAAAVLPEGSGLPAPAPLAIVTRGGPSRQGRVAVSVPADLPDRDAPRDEPRRSPSLTGEEFWRADDLVNAEKAYQAALAKATDPKQAARLLLMLAMIHHQMGDDRTAKAEFQDAVSRANIPEVQLFLAKFLLDSGDREEAKKALENYVKQEPQNAAAARLLQGLDAPAAEAPAPSGAFPMGNAGLAAPPLSGAIEADRYGAEDNFYKAQDAHFKFKKTDLQKAMKPLPAPPPPPPAFADNPQVNKLARDRGKAAGEHAVLLEKLQGALSPEEKSSMEDELVKKAKEVEMLDLQIREFKPPEETTVPPDGPAKP